ncbi:uncharacterized protein LOC110854565 isoform X2 [Folsomia candida]|uniref:Uncharacterized protein n=1 Tax=Folsomia candida TaxID=158441 RepID=A0A226DZ17_FOLCA|nr:uncharacterized protein LOC110854565 isoform X2 [Folsomia candida]OXA49446.1 hypothetical protein Fcan01_15615 [Folsomia candida]
MWVLPPTIAPETPIPYRVHLPTLTQFVTGQNFHYFKLRLFDIDRFFQGKKHTWNHDYPPGQKIYSDTPSACTIRSLISAEHSILYSSRDLRMGNVDGFLERTPAAFFALLEKYADSSAPILSTMHAAIKSSYEFVAGTPTTPPVDETLKIYTYVLMDRSLRFSRCGAGTSVDMSSKHALHAGALPEVCYAGEFWIEPAPGANEWGKVMYMDNNSGTFAPPRCDLYKMKSVMDANFPGIPIVFLDYQDLEWKRRRGKEQ